MLDDIHAETPIGLIIEGGAAGADELAALWADVRDVPKRKFEANWNAYGRAAGPRRNAIMLAEGRPDLVVALPGGRGTADCVRQAERAGVPVQRIAGAVQLGHQAGDVIPPPDMSRERG